MTTTLENLHEIVTVGGHQFAVDGAGNILDKIVEQEERDRATGKPQDADNDPDKSKSSDVPEPSEATKDAMKMASPELRNLMQEYRDWIIAVGSANIPAGSRSAKIDELLLDFHMKAARIPQAETAESKASRMLVDAGLASLSDATKATLAGYIREGRTDKVREFLADWRGVAEQCGRTSAAMNVKTVADGMAFLRS